MFRKIIISVFVWLAFLPTRVWAGDPQSMMPGAPAPSLLEWLEIIVIILVAAYFIFLLVFNFIRILKNLRKTR